MGRWPDPSSRSHSAAAGGGGERIRTDGLLRARQALSQLSYTPEKAALKMVGLDGFEPSTSRLSGVRSDQAELQAPRSAGLGKGQAFSGRLARWRIMR